MPKTDKSSASAEQIRHAIKVDRRAASVGLFFFGAACGITAYFFQDQAPRHIFVPWLLAMLFLLAFWLLCLIALFARTPSQRELIHIWAPVAKCVLVACDLIVISSIWLMLPYASREITLAMSVLYMAHVPTKIMGSPENTELNRFTIAAVLGSLCVYLLLSEETVESLLAVFVAFFGIVMLALSHVVRSAFRSTVKARLQSEASAKKLEGALQEVAAERDAKTKFIAAASHDLAQPLQAINLFFDQSLRAPDHQARELAVSGVRRALHSAEQQLSHMLNHLRLEADAVQPHPSRLPLSQFLEKICEQYQPSASQNYIDLQYCRTRLVANADPSLLQRAIGNLIANAVAHSHASRILVGARLRTNGKMQIWVIDNGNGVNPSEARHIFDDYFRGSRSEANSKIGFGLGLASVKRIAKLMNGHCGLDERWLRGAAFYFELPAYACLGRQERVALTPRIRVSHEKLPNL